MKTFLQKYKILLIIFITTLFCPVLVQAREVCCVYNYPDENMSCQFAKESMVDELTCRVDPTQGLICDAADGGLKDVLGTQGVCKAALDDGWEITNIFGVAGVKYYKSDTPEGGSGFCPEISSITSGGVKYEPIKKTEINGPVAGVVCVLLSDSSINWSVQKADFDAVWKTVEPSIVNPKPITVSCNGRITVLETSQGETCRWPVSSFTDAGTTTAQEKYDEMQNRCESLCETDSQCTYNKKDGYCCLKSDPNCKIGVTGPSTGGGKVTGDVENRYKVPDGYTGPLPKCAFAGDCNDVNQLLELVINIGKWFFSIIGSLAFVFFVYGGFTMILSFGSAEKFKKGQQVLIAAVIGMLIAFGAYALVNFLLVSLGVSESLIFIK